MGSLDSRSLTYYKGDYDTFERTRVERAKHQQSAFESIEAKKKHMQSFIDRFRYNANRAALVQSRIKALERMEAVEEVVDDPKWRFSFPDPGPLGVPLLQMIDVGFGYNPSHLLFDDVNFGLTMDSRLAILGKNGTGKSTLLKLILGELNPTVRSQPDAGTRVLGAALLRCDARVCPVDFASSCVRKGRTVVMGC